MIASGFSQPNRDDQKNGINILNSSKEVEINLVEPEFK